MINYKQLLQSPVQISVVVQRWSLIVELRELVTRYNHMLHPCLRDHHQVSHSPADVVSAHGQSESCEHRHKGMK